MASLDATQEALLGGIGDAVQAAIEQETGRAFAAASRTEPYDGNGRATLYLRHDPITAVASVTRDGEALTVGSSLSVSYPPATCLWEADPTRIGALKLTDGSTFTRGIANILVTYTAGWGVASVPAGLVHAGVMWAAYVFTNGRFPGAGVITNAAAFGERPKSIDQMIRPFRRAWAA